MALVESKDSGPFVEGLEGAHPADTEQDPLAEAVLGAAAGEPVRHLAEVIGVLVDVGVKKVELDAADVSDPDAGGQVLAAEVDRDPVPSTGARAMAWGSMPG